jgi:diacylglycerol kinase (ATP)
VVTALVGLEARPVEFSCDGGPAEAGPFTLLSFCNTQYTGGAMCMAPGADAADGRVDVVRIGPMGRRRLLTSFPRIFRGTHPQMREVAMSRAGRVDFAPAPPVPVMIDGEIRTLSVHSLVVRPGALELLA